LLLTVALAIGSPACNGSEVKPLPACGADGWRPRNDPKATATISHGQAYDILDGKPLPPSVENLDGDGTEAKDRMLISVKSTDLSSLEMKALGELIAAPMSDFPEVADLVTDSSLPDDQIRFKMFTACTPPSPSKSA